MRALATRVAVAAVVTAVVGACGGSGTFGLSSEDNQPELVAQALRLRQAPEAGTPINELGKPLAFLSVRGKKADEIEPSLVAYDLHAKEELWRQTTEVDSKVHVGANFVVHVDGAGKVVGRDLATGNQTWAVTPGGSEFLGLASDARRAYYVIKGSGTKPVWWLVALDGASGAELWRADAPGQLGAPEAQGGLVFSPFLKQWLAVLDANTGEQVARIRGIDEEISFVRVTSQDVYFGSKLGVFRFDERAASGKRAESTYGRATMPGEFVRSHYYWDAFDKIQARYSAYDRNRILWRGEVSGDDLGFEDGIVVVHTFRFFFGINAADGSLEWAYNHPRTDVVASAHVGPSIAFVAGNGKLGALDPATGARIYSAELDVPGVNGATFDADGWKPAGEAKKTDTVAALMSIARDRDARFNDVKQFAVTALATLPGGEVSRDLVALIQNERTPPKLYDKAVEVLVGRADPAGLPFLVEALGVRHDYIEGTAPKAVGVIARAIAALDGKELEPAARGSAVEALLAHLNAPETPMAELPDVIKALGAVGAGAELEALRTFLLVYRADPAFSAQIGAASAAIDVLLDKGGAAEREVVAFVAEDPRTQQGIAEYAERALLQTADKT